MSVKIWYSASQAFTEPQNVPRRYDTRSGAYVDTTGKAYSQTDEAWEEKWSNIDSGVLYDNGIINKNYYQNISFYHKAYDKNAICTLESSEGSSCIYMHFASNNSGRINSGIDIRFSDESENILNNNIKEKLLDEGYTNINVYAKIVKSTSNNNGVSLYVGDFFESTYAYDVIVGNAGEKITTVTCDLSSMDSFVIRGYVNNYYPIDATIEIYKIWAT